jgi:hypothetical protein
MGPRTRSRASMARIGVTCLLAASLWSATPVGAQSGSEGPEETCEPGDVYWPCASAEPAHPPLNGSISWSEAHAEVPGGLGSSVRWDSSISFRLVWLEDARTYVPSSGTYAYDYQLSGHCTGSVSGSGVLSTEPYAAAASGVARVTADASDLPTDPIDLAITIWRDDYVAHCAATDAFPATDDIDPGVGFRPLCTTVQATLPSPDAATYTVSCDPQEIPGIEVILSGALVKEP